MRAAEATVPVRLRLRAARRVIVRESIPEPVGETADLTNASGSPVRVTGVQLAGIGLGRILAIRSNEIAPFGASLRTTPAGICRVPSDMGGR